MRVSDQIAVSLPQLTQLLRFAVVGVATNVLLYLLYLGLTSSGIWPKAGMTVTYVIGVLFSFWLNRTWTYRSTDGVSRRFIRYVLAYVIGYCVNLAGLYFGVDVAGYFHAYVQGAMVVVVACLMFLLQKYWVFAEPKGNAQGYMDS